LCTRKINVNFGRVSSSIPLTGYRVINIKQKNMLPVFFLCKNRDKAMCFRGADCTWLPADPLNPQCGECPHIHPALPALSCQHGDACVRFRCPFAHSPYRRPDCIHMTQGECKKHNTECKRPHRISNALSFF
jgi:hypothetical protein